VRLAARTIRAACLGLGLSTLGIDALAQEQNGHSIAEEYCAMCHAIGMSGTSPHRGAPPFRRLGDLTDLTKLGEAFERGTFLVSHPDMPTFKLDRSQAHALIAYLRSIQQ
jgi:mono/diheme cytochrome c family protein